MACMSCNGPGDAEIAPHLHVPANNSFPNSDISSTILLSLLGHDEPQGTFAFGRRGTRSSSDVDGHRHPKHSLRPHTSQPFGIINSNPTLT